MNPLQYLQSRIFNPVGIKYADWIHDDAGNPHIPNGAYLTPRNWIKFGQFILQQGWWEGEQVIGEALMQELRLATGPNPGHGKFIWLNQSGGYPAAGLPLPPAGISGGFIYHNGRTDIVAAMGAGKNRMYIIPSLEAVVLRQTLRDSDTFQDHLFLSALLEE
jgi:CubicO group peptidase (beta-lactamase class C family)